MIEIHLVQSAGTRGELRTSAELQASAGFSQAAGVQTKRLMTPLSGAHQSRLAVSIMSILSKSECRP